MKRITLIVLIILSIVIKVEVKAATSAIPSQGSYYTELKTKYEESSSAYKSGTIEKTEISTTGIVTIYGKSVCDGSKCSHSYYNEETNPEEILKKVVKCQNGEGYIKYQEPTTGKSEFENNSTLEGTAYWSEDYPVTCTTGATGNQVVAIEQTNGTNNNNNSNTGNSNSTGNNTNNNTTNNGSSSTDTGNQTNGEYDSSSTVDNSQTGVNTYFMVLGIVGIISYVCMRLIKRYNLFKNI